MSAAPVHRRLVVVLPGFEALAPLTHARRFVREAKAAAAVYGLDVSAAGGFHELDIGAITTMSTHCDGAETVAEIIFSDLDRALGPHRAKDPLTRFVSGFGALADFLLTGTVWRFARTSWRFVLFFLFPVFCLFLAALAGWLGSLIVGSAITTPAVVYLSAATFTVVALVAAVWQFHLLLALDLWTFAADLARGRDRRVELAVDRLAEAVSRRWAEGRFNEVIVAGHSIGAVLAVGLAARVTRGGACRPHVLTVGSTLLQVALHPAAMPRRAEVAEVARHGLCWLDVQSLADPINFFRSNPVSVLGAGAPASVRTMSVRFRHQLDPAHYARIRFNPFRIHRQFVLAVERPSPYSFHVILCGPERFEDIARRPGLNTDESRMRPK
ncbi:MAG: hypothetical protein ACK4F5_09980 [Aliihoeflea sp.]